MDTGSITVSDTYISTEDGGTPGVAWPAIIGGAIAAVGLMLVLSPLGAALGITWAPWTYNGNGNGARVFTIAAAVWLIIVQWLSSAFGGYLTGRLRMKWPAAAHTHEVFFRDTMHGFLSWALASVAAASLLAVIAAAGSSSSNGASSSYLTNDLFRTATAVTVTDQDRAESEHILATGAANGRISDYDRNTLVQLIVSRTGIPAIEADTRIDNALAREQAEAREAAHASIFVCLSLLIGAFIASAAGALGGAHRDLHYATGKLRP